MAARTAVYFVGKADKGFGKAVYLFRFAAQQVESHSEGGFAPYPGKGGYLFYCQRKYFGRISLVIVFFCKLYRIMQADSLHYAKMRKKRLTFA